MNWLAHVFLSKSDLDFKLGNLLADRIKKSELQNYSPSFAAGVKCHFEIDRYTDNHKVVRVSKGRIFEKYKHFAAVLVDIYYDHLLVRNWGNYSDVSYEVFVEDFYASLPERAKELSPEAREMLHNIVKYNVIGHYDTLEGVSLALKRITYRMKRPDLIDITDGADSLAEHMKGFEEDFLQFWPDLQEHITRTHLT